MANRVNGGAQSGSDGPSGGAALREPRAGERDAGRKAKQMADEQIDDRNGRDDDREESRGSGAARGKSPRTSGGFFDVYKGQQGRSVRLGTAIIAGVLLLWGAAFFYEHLPTPDYPAVLRYGLPTLLLIGGGLAAYHFLARDMRVIDFMIATEGEMKKVHWTSRKEVIGSTKVVVFVLLFMSVAMFVIDLGLLVFFSEIGVIKFGRDAISAMLGGS